MRDDRRLYAEGKGVSVPDLIMFAIGCIAIGIFIGEPLGRRRNNSFWKQRYQFTQQMLDIIIESLLKGGRK